MGDAHEAWLARLLSGRQSRGSGNQWNDQMDGRHNSYTSEDVFNFAWDGKSTLGNSIGLTRAMIEKAMEQAGAEEPILAFRFYRNEELEVDHDYIVVKAEIFAEMMRMANAYEGLKTEYLMEIDHG